MNRRRFLAALATLGFASCMPRDESQQARFDELEVEHMLVLVIDLSGSFHSILLGEDGNGGKALRTINKAIADFTEGGRDKAHDRIILAQISGRYPPSLLYDGNIANFE